LGDINLGPNIREPTQRMLMLAHTRQSGCISKMPDKRGGHMIFNDREPGWRG